MFRYLVLGLLRDGTCLHGYALMKDYRERAGVQLSTGSFYREIQRLVAEGLVQTASNPADADPRRAPYQITELGSAAFDAWLTGPTGLGLGRYDDELSSRVLFLANADPVVAYKLIDGWKEELWLRSKMHERSRGPLIVPRDDREEHSFGALRFLLARNLKHLAADLEFLDEFKAAYSEWAETQRDQTPKAPRAGIGRSPQRRLSRGKQPDGRR
jgi:DNA-binding PadR family transcriptional regulator